MTTEVSTQIQLKPATSTSLATQNAAAMLFGLVILFMVGFSPMQVAHNAAHDVRHSIAFPCH